MPSKQCSVVSCLYKKGVYKGGKIHIYYHLIALVPIRDSTFHFVFHLQYTLKISPVFDDYTAICFAV